MKAQIREIARRHSGTMTDAQYLSMVYALEELDREKDKEFWSYDNIEKIILTYKSFQDRSCPSELVHKTIDKLRPF